MITVFGELGLPCFSQTSGIRANRSTGRRHGMTNPMRGWLMHGHMGTEQTCVTFPHGSVVWCDSLVVLEKPHGQDSTCEFWWFWRNPMDRTKHSKIFLRRQVSLHRVTKLEVKSCTELFLSCSQ